MKVNLLIGIGFLATTVLLQAEACQSEKLPGCLVGLKTPGQLKYVYTKEEIQSICKSLEDFLVCLDDTGCRSMPTVEPMADRLRLSVNFICIDQLDEYMQHERCLNSENVKKSQDFCANETRSATDGSTTCENRNFVFSCFVQSVGECCGSAAGSFVDRFLQVMLQPMSTNDCQSQSDLEVPTPQFCKTLSTTTDFNTSSTLNYNVFVVLLSIGYTLIWQ